MYIFIQYDLGGWRFYGIPIILSYLMPNSVYTYTKYIGFGLFGFNGISIIVDYLMPNPFYTYILNT